MVTKLDYVGLLSRRLVLALPRFIGLTLTAQPT